MTHQNLDILYIMTRTPKYRMKNHTLTMIPKKIQIIPCGVLNQLVLIMKDL